MDLDNALLKYDLAIVAILKNEAPYMKEWIEYHVLAGVDHFYLYDNESEDNLKEVLQPYINAGIVDYKYFPGKCAQMAVYNEAIQNYRFACNYMAFIDADEFILPRGNISIKDVLKEIVAPNKNVAGLAMNWRIFGSSGQEKADFSKGVLERFLYRANDDFEVNKHVKIIINPRCIDVIANQHYFSCLSGKIYVNENLNRVHGPFNSPCTTNKICINHYFSKSREEYIAKKNRGKADVDDSQYDMQMFDEHDKNDIFDDEILVYRRNRFEQWNNDIESQQIINNRIFNAMIKNLLPVMIENSPKDSFNNKIETFLICWSIAQELRNVLLDDADANYFEERSLKGILKSLMVGEIEICQLELLIDVLPKILFRPFPIVQEIKDIVIQLIPKFLKYKQMENAWKNHKQLSYILQLLQLLNIKY